MGFKRRFNRFVFKLAILGAVSAVVKYFSDFKAGGARRKKIMSLVGKG